MSEIESGMWCKKHGYFIAPGCKCVSCENEAERARAARLESEAAAMREALKGILSGLADESPTAEDFGAQIPDIIAAALAPSAGRDLLARLERAEGRVAEMEEAAKAVLCAWDEGCDDMGGCIAWLRSAATDAPAAPSAGKEGA